MMNFSFITFRSAKHLDNHHTVFGKVVDGLEVLKVIEDVPTDNNDRPLVLHINSSPHFLIVNSLLFLFFAPSFHKLSGLYDIENEYGFCVFERRILFYLRLKF